MKIPVACVQARAHDREAFEARLPELLALIERAALQARIVVVPEGTVPAYVIGTTSLDFQQLAQAERAIATIARRHRSIVVYGSARPESGKLHNSALVIGPDGERLGATDKRFLWHFDRRWFAPGTTLEPIPTPLGNLGILICADGRIPLLASALVDRGADLLVMPTAWVTSGRDPQALENIQADLLARVRAKENGVPLLAANKCGVEAQSVLYCGKSQIVDRDGSLLALASEREETILFSELELPNTNHKKTAPSSRAGMTTRFPSAATPMQAMRVAISSSDDPGETRALARQAALADAELLIARTSLDDTEIPVLDPRFVDENEIRSIVLNDRLPACIMGANAFLDPRLPAQARLAGTSAFIWSGCEDDAWSVAFARARAVELRSFVVTVTERRAFACDPDGAILCGTCDDYRVAAFAYDPARCAQTTVAPRTDVLDGLRAARGLASALALLLLVIFAALRPAFADLLPDSIAPAAPFPAIRAQSLDRDAVVPGVELGRYYLMTARGPLTLNALALDPHLPSLRLNSALADDRLTSSGETVSSMARRTNAVAGINADFFDIGNTYQPIGILVRDGRMLRSPSARAALAITRERDARFGPIAFGGTVRDGNGASWPLSGIDTEPENNGVSLILPSFGAIATQADQTLAVLDPLAGTPNIYRVSALAAAPHEATTALVFPTSIAASGDGLPKIGDTIGIAFDTTPPLNDIVAAVGGGPQLLRDGLPYDDPFPPAPGEALAHVPLSGALRRADGSLILLEVDGRAPERSIGIDRPEFAALLRAFGGIDGMAFDGGGSATLVARLPGEADAAVLNHPSDGHERAVSDGLFVYDDTPPEPPSRLALPQFPKRLFVGAAVALTPVVIDADGRPTATNAPICTHAEIDPPGAAAILPDGLSMLATHPGHAIVRVRCRVGGQTLSVETPLEIVDRVARLRVEPENPNPDPGALVPLRALAFDEAGAPIDVDGSVLWSARLPYHAGTKDDEITAQVGTTQSSVFVRVGRREIALDVFRHDGPAARAWRFASLPASDAPGGVEIDDDDVLALSYDFSDPTRERIAQAMLDARLDGLPLALALDVQGDGGGERLRVTLTTADGDPIPFTLAKRVDWQGWRTLTLTLPREAVPPLTLTSFSVSAPKDASEDRPGGAGTIALRRLRMLFAGTSTSASPYHLRESPNLDP